MVTAGRAYVVTHPGFQQPVAAAGQTAAGPAGAPGWPHVATCVAATRLQQSWPVMSPLHRLALLVALAVLHTSTAETKLQAWLDEIGEGAHAPAFEAEGFATLEELVSTGLEEADLAELGLGLKARRKISKVLRNLADPTKSEHLNPSPLVDNSAKTRTATSRDTSSPAGKWPSPSALRRFIDPTEVSPPGQGSKLWDISSVVHPGTEALTTLSADPRLEQWDGFFSSDEVNVLLDALTGDRTIGPDAWMPPWSHHDYKYSASGEAKLYLKYLHPSLGDDNRSKAAVSAIQDPIRSRLSVCLR
eukprot:COSAG02_NODE_284_length_25691_cov_14.733354_20_plen_303_part_00